VGTISIIRNDASEVVTIQNANAIASAAGFFNQVGAVTTNATFDVDGATITLDQNYPDYDAMALDIASQLTGYTVTNNAGTLSITNDILGSAAVIISNADANAIAANITNATGTAGTGSGSLTLAAGDLSIAVGDGTAVPFVGTYDTARDLATAINRELNGIAAEITTDGKLKLLSTQQLTISGTEAGTGGIIGFDTLIIEPTVGDLSTANVTSVTDANETIVRIDAALTSVSNLRSTFGAIQNRFESTISNLTATAENMTASRSRIMDADFAMETANLTRAQILQQAGTAMLAQANQIPQNVLSLLG
jgi:flagellin